MLSAIVNPTLAKHGIPEAQDCEGGVKLMGQVWGRDDLMNLIRGLERKPQDIPASSWQARFWQPKAELLEPFEDWMNGLEPCPDFVFALYCNLISGRCHPVVYLNRARLEQYRAPDSERGYWVAMVGLLEQINSSLVGGLR